MSFTRFGRSALGAFVRSPLGVRGDGEKRRAFFCIRKADASFHVFCVEESINGTDISAAVTWSTQITGLASAANPQMAYYRGSLYLVAKPASTSDEALFRIDPGSGTILASVTVLLEDGGSGAILDRPGIAVNSNGVFVVDNAQVNTAGGYSDFELILFNRTTLAEEDRAQNPISEELESNGGAGISAGFGNLMVIPFNTGTANAYARVAGCYSETSGLSMGSAFPEMYRFEADLTWSGNGNTLDDGDGYWWTANYLGAGGGLPGTSYWPIFCHSFSQEVFSGSTEGWFHWTKMDPGAVPADNVYDASTEHVYGAGCSGGVNGSGQPILIRCSMTGVTPVVMTLHKKVPNPSGSTIYTKDTTSDLLTDVSLSLGAAAHVLRYSDGELWIVYQGRVDGVDAGLLVAYTEDGTTLTERWRIDLTADATSDWSNPRTATSLRFWLLDIFGGGYDHY